MIERDGAQCSIYLEQFPKRDLQIDHRVPFEVAGDNAGRMNNAKDYMLLSESANRAKSWSCEHVAMRQTRRADILWSGENEVSVYDRLKTRTQELQKNLPEFIKELVEKHLEE